MRAQGYLFLFISQLDERSRLPAEYIASFPPFLQLIRVAQRITRSATNREIAGSNPVTDNEIFVILKINALPVYIAYKTVFSFDWQIKVFKLNFV